MLQKFADLQNMMVDDSGDELLLACLTPQQDVIGTEGGRLLTPIDGGTSVMTNTSEATSTGVTESTNEIPRIRANLRQDSMDFLTSPPPPQTVMMVSEVGVDVTDDIVDEPIDSPTEEMVLNSATSTDNAPNPHFYVGYVPDDIPERIRPYVVDTTVGIDVAGNNLPDNFDYTEPCTSNQTGGGGGGGGAVNHDNSDTDTAPGTEDEDIEK